VADVELSPDPAAVWPMSWEEYDAWAAQDDDSVRGEYLDGVFIVTPHPSVRHQTLSLRLAMALHPQVSPPYLVIQDVGWTPPGERQEPGPDLSVFWRHDEGRRITRTPVLAVEILSRDRKYDIEYKRALYARWALPTYWIIDPRRGGTLRVHELRDGELVETERHVDGTRSLSFGPFTVALDLDALFA